MGTWMSLNDAPVPVRSWDPRPCPREERGNIGRLTKPTGWHTVKYDGIEGNYLYNRAAI